MRFAPVLIVLSVVAACGCIAPGGPSAGSPTGATETPTPTPTDSTSTGTPTVADPPADARDGTTVEYGDLTATQQAAFDAALGGEARFVPNTSYVDGEFHFEDADPFRSHRYVRKNGTYYEIDRSSGELYASYGIDATVGTPGPDENATVVDVGNLSADVRDEVRWAIENGTHSVPAGKWQSLPVELQDTRYVRYEDEVYRLGYAVGDSWALVLTVERAD